jgi:hypothetical protein
VNAHIIDVFDEIVGALLKPRDFFPNAMWANPPVLLTTNLGPKAGDFPLVLSNRGRPHVPWRRRRTKESF